MPKITWAVAPPNYLAELFRRYKAAQHLTSADIAKRLGCSAENVRAQLNKPMEQWRIKDLKRYCRAVNVPLEEALDCIKIGGI